MSAETATANPGGDRKRCAKCGACAPVCPVFRASGNEIYTARGKQHLAEILGEGRPSPAFEDIYAKCLLCGACAAVCPQHLDIPAEVIRARAGFSRFYGEHGYQKYLARQALNRPELLGAARVLGKTAADILFSRLPPASGLRLRLALFAQSPSPGEVLPSPPQQAGNAGAEGALTYYPGCAASHLYPDIVASIREVLSRHGLGLNIPAGLGCCGLASLASGQVDEAAQLARRNIEALEAGDGPILVSCGSCFAHLAAYGELLEEDPAWKARARLVSERVVEISVFLEALLREEEVAAGAGAATLKVFYHDPCHLRLEAQITEEPRKVLAALTRVELVELENGPQCCGQGGLFHVGAPELSARIRDDLADKIIALHPDLITTTCSGCIMQLKSAMAAKGQNIPVVHLTALVNSLAARRPS